ncbi:GNAT family protein [Planococcus sp. N028]|uniref:GNAT family protein n=1 Tax=Planococcus shixiaomingii TaxID=3058393 RepID=A0ABT8N5P4_9BACL|nr:GNAT family protein [Planococcus sp. N028]MDN7243049.1 GNAT family protein [Planococcus sp. N028]
MDFQLAAMTQEQAEEISFNWHYEGKYSFYDMEADVEDLKEFLDPETRGDMFYSAMKDGQLIGFFSFEKTASGTVDVGLGMRPDLTGSGNGQAFLMAGIAFARETYKPEKLTLSVAVFNKRAISLYKKVGFQEVETFRQDTNGGNFEFLRMVYDCKGRDRS